MRLSALLPGLISTLRFNLRLWAEPIGADTPVRLTKSEAALLGSVPSPLFEKAAAEVTADIDPFDDVHASAIYRCEVAAALAIRTLTEAWERDT